MSRYFALSCALLSALFISLASADKAADKAPKEVHGTIASISEPDDKGVVTITIMDGSRKDAHVVSVTVDSNTKITEKKKTRDVKALEVREVVNATGEQPATQIDILSRKPRKE